MTSFTDVPVPGYDIPDAIQPNKRRGNFRGHGPVEEVRADSQTHLRHGGVRPSSAHPPSRLLAGSLFELF